MKQQTSYLRDNSTAAGPGPDRRFALIGLVALVLAIYFTRVTALPVSGEEGRWARGAVQMIESGDWIVPRQQGEVFPERPPMSSWAMALGGLLWGEVDAWAIRLPSVIAILLTTSIIYFYSSKYLSTFGAFAAGAVYATSAQVMEIGRMGESEAVFSLFLSASLLLWHYGYVRWRPLTTWIVGYSLMALAALVKGPQAPTYFVAATFLYLAIRRDWKYLLNWPHLAGIAAGAGVMAAWQVPFYLATDRDAVVATWAGLAGDRFTIRGLIVHVLTYPLETIACLLPWSPLLVVYLRRGFRDSIAPHREMLSFLVTALAITFPTVWFASGARGRYFMPIYPFVAILIGLVMQKCAESVAGSRTRKDWNRFAYIWAGVMPAVGLGVLYVSVVADARFIHFRQPVAFALLLAIATVVGAALLGWTCRRNDAKQTAIVFVTVCVFSGLFWTGVVVNSQKSRWNDLRPAVAAVKEKLPVEVRLVSFSPADHRFCYFYRDAIKQLAWPETMSDVPDEVEYFCINRHAGDTAEQRKTGRGRSWSSTSGTLPFEWEEIARVPCERKIRETPAVEVVIGRIVRKPNRVRTAVDGDAKTNR